MELKVNSFTYKWHADWAKLPAMEGHSHHGLVISKDGHIVTGHATKSKILILDKQGNLLREINTPLVENHGICLAEENGEEILWICDAAGKVIKMTFDGTVLKALSKADLGYGEEQPFAPTAIAWDAASGKVFIADGYGSSLVTCLSPDYEVLCTLDGNDGLGRFSCPHWAYVDTRKEVRELYIADRSNDRVQIYDLDGRFLRGIDEGLVTPSVFGHFGDHMVIGELNARLVLLDKDDLIIGYIGDGSHHVKKAGWPNRHNANDEAISPLADIPVGEFNSPHGMACDSNGDIYVSEWLLGDRFTKLELVSK
jgi:hypothetical protein